MAKTIKIIELPGLKLKEDIVDWVGNGGTLDGLITLVNSTDETVESAAVQNKPIGNIYEDGFCYYKYYKKQIINIHEAPLLINSMKTTEGNTFPYFKFLTITPYLFKFNILKNTADKMGSLLR